jgi:transposase-like protein
MKRRKWDAETKARIVLAGLDGGQVTQICRQYEIRPSQYYKWRDIFINNSARVFEAPPRCRDNAGLEAENARLKKLVGELTLKLNNKN